MKMKKILNILVVIAIAMLSATAVHATSLPWLDFGSNLYWNSNTNTLTDGGLAFVNSVTYRDNTTTPPPPLDAAFMSPVTLSLSFSGSTGSGTVSIGSWLTADLTYSGPAVNPLGFTPNPAIIRMSNINVTTGAGSRWADEFDATLNPSLLYPARLNISWLGSNFDYGDGTYKVNASGKVAPIPEPGTLALLGSGLLGTGFYARRRKKRA